MNNDISEGAFHLVFPLISNFACIRPLKLDDYEKHRKLAMWLERRNLSAKIYMFDDGKTNKTPYAPTYVRTRFGGVINISNLEYMVDGESITKYLASEGFDSTAPKIELNIWGYGIVTMDFKVEFTTESNNLSRSTLVLEHVRETFIPNDYIERNKQLEDTLRLLYQGAYSTIRMRNPWPSLHKKLVKRMTPYAISMEIFRVDDQLHEKEAICQSFCGSSEKPTSYTHEGIFYYMAGYDGQSVILNKESSYLVESLWRLCALYWGCLKECDFQLAEKADDVVETRQTLSQLRREISDLQYSMTFFHGIRKEGSAEAIADHELERAVYTPTWRSWDGDALASRLVDRVDNIDKLIDSKRQELIHNSSRTMNILLFFIAILSTSSLSELAFSHLLRHGYITSHSQLVFESSFLLAMFVIAGIVTLWPRRI